MLVIVCYDVSVLTPEGRRRLRRVAKRCERIGVRVQKSVFECRIDQAMFESLERDLLKEIEVSEDCLRFYRLTEPVNLYVREHGKFQSPDFSSDSLVV